MSHNIMTKIVEIDSSAFIHTRNIRSLSIEMFRDSKNLSPPIMNDIFTQKSNSRYNLRQFLNFPDHSWIQYTTEAKVFHF